MKIAFVITDITRCAGTERVVVNIANYLVNHSHNISIISLSSAKGGAYFALDERIKIVHLNAYSYTGKGFWSKIRGRFSALRKFNKAMGGSHADIYIGTSVNTNVLLLLFCHSSKIIGCEHFAATVPMNYFLRIFRNLMYRRLDYLVVLTQRDYNYYHNRGVNAIIIPNSVPFVISEGFRNGKKALAIGRHTQQKSFDRLLEIWRKVEDVRTDWELLIIGEGDLLEYNRGIANKLGLKTVRFLPFQKNVYDFYLESSLYLMTSLYEALPMVLIEAKMCGCVCISYDCETGPAEIIKTGEDGFLIPNGKNELFISQVLALMDDAALRERMSKKAIINSKEYLPENILPKWEMLIDNICK